MITRTVLALALVLAPMAPATATGAAAPDAGVGVGVSTRDIATTRWSTTRQLRHGDAAGVRLRRGQITFGQAVSTRTYRARTYETTRWTSPWVRPGFGLTELIASWNATTPPGTWIEVAVRGRTLKHRTGDWDVLGRWAGGDRRIHRTSAGPQADGPASVNVDTVQTDGRARLSQWQLQVRLMRVLGTAATPSVQSIGAVASALPAGHTRSATTMKRERDLAVPRYSQMIHRGEYPQWDNGGEAWCSPTSMSMILAYWKSGPTPRQYRWVRDPYRQPWVDQAARYSYDYRYEGTGNWPFNTAYAATFGLDAFVTRLRSLREAERFVRAGIPLVASISFGTGELDRSPIGSTNGHVLVIRGFTVDGDVIVNDPAASRAKGVRRVYDRGQFGNAWLDTTGGTTYVVHPAGTPLPKRTPQASW